MRFTHLVNVDVIVSGVAFECRLGRGPDVRHVASVSHPIEDVWAILRAAGPCSVTGAACGPSPAGEELVASCYDEGVGLFGSVVSVVN